MDLIREEEDGEGGESEAVIEEQEANPLIRLVDSFIFAALERRASDIHIESQEAAVTVKYRIDGVLQPAMQPIDKAFHSSIISRIKVMSELDIAERRVPQDGRFRVRYQGRPIDFRVSIMPSTNGEDAVLRILDKKTLSEKFRQLRLNVLGLSERDMKRFRRFISEPYGMVLVTGPTGSGKTTTLYAAISEIKTDEDKIITIEDPVEYQISGITQIPVNDRKGLTFARGLRSILRHDPDKIMVGENSRPGDRPGRHPVGVNRAPGLHYRARQQCGRRAGPIPEYGCRTLQLRLGAQLHPGAAAGADHLRSLSKAGKTYADHDGGILPRPGGVEERPGLSGNRMPGM